MQALQDAEIQPVRSGDVNGGGDAADSGLTGRTIRLDGGIGRQRLEMPACQQLAQLVRQLRYEGFDVDGLPAIVVAGFQDKP